MLNNQRVYVMCMLIGHGSIMGSIPRSRMLSFFSHRSQGASIQWGRFPRGIPKCRQGFNWRNEMISSKPAKPKWPNMNQIFGQALSKWVNRWSFTGETLGHYRWLMATDLGCAAHCLPVATGGKGVKLYFAKLGKKTSPAVVPQAK